MEQKKKGGGNWEIREGKWNKKVGTARWDGGGKRSWKGVGCKRGGLSWVRSSLKMGEGART